MPHRSFHPHPSLPNRRKELISRPVAPVSVGLQTRSCGKMQWPPALANVEGRRQELPETLSTKRPPRTNKDIKIRALRVASPRNGGGGKSIASVGREAPSSLKSCAASLWTFRQTLQRAHRFEENNKWGSRSLGRSYGSIHWTSRPSTPVLREVPLTPVELNDDFVDDLHPSTGVIAHDGPRLCASRHAMSSLKTPF